MPYSGNREIHFLKCHCTYACVQSSNSLHSKRKMDVIWFWINCEVCW